MSGVVSCSILWHHFLMMCTYFLNLTKNRGCASSTKMNCNKQYRPITSIAALPIYSVILYPFYKLN